MASLPTKITTDLLPDGALNQSATRAFDKTDRQYVDTQIRGCQQHLSDSLLNGLLATWARVASASATLAKGDVVCLAAVSASELQVTLATPAALTAAGSAFGIALDVAAPGARARIAKAGALSPSITGLAALAGVVRVSSAGRPERVAAYGSGDVPLGHVNALGFMVLALDSSTTTAAVRTTVPPLGGGADDGANLTAALAAMAGVGTVELTAGTYNIETPIDFLSDCILIGHPQARLLSVMANTGGVDNAVLRAYPPAPAISTTLASPTVIGSDQITVSSAAGWSIGMELAISNDNTSAQYVITNIAGTTFTLDRPLKMVFPTSGTSVQDYQSTKRIQIDGRGMRVSGTGDSGCEFSRGYRNVLRNVHFDGSFQDTTCNFFEVGGRELLAENILLDCNGAISGFNYEGVESCVARNIIVRGAAQAGILIGGSWGNFLESVRAEGCNVGIQITHSTLTSGGVPAKGLEVFGCSVFNNAVSGVVIENGASEISIHGLSSWQNDGTALAIGTSCKDIGVHGYKSHGDSVGMAVGAGSEVWLYDASINNTTGGVNGYACVVEGTIYVRGFTSREADVGGFQVVSNGRLDIDGFEVSASFNGFWAAFVSSSTIGVKASRGRILMSGTGTKLVFSHTGTGVEELSCLTTTGGTLGWSGNAGGYRRGPDVDFSSCATPWDIQGSATEQAWTSGPAEWYTVTATTQTKRFGITSTQIDVGAPLIAFASTLTNPIVRQTDDATASATGDTLRVQAQNATGTTATGGKLELASGTGTSAAGSVVVLAGSATRIEADPTGLGFFGVTPAARPAAYTQTYSTASRTHAAYTPDDESAAYTGIDNAQPGAVYATVADLNALRVAYENERAAHASTKAVLNSLIDDWQALGLLQ